jgi:hypothetical protein
MLGKRKKTKFSRFYIQVFFIFLVHIQEEDVKMWTYMYVAFASISQQSLHASVTLCSKP